MSTLATALYRMASHTPTRVTNTELSSIVFMCVGIPCQKCNRKLCTCKVSLQQFLYNIENSKYEVVHTQVCLNVVVAIVVRGETNVYTLYWLV